MFIYWDGFEIDGSDTTFNLILSEREILADVIEYYLSLPLWDKKSGINFVTDGKFITSHRYGYKQDTIGFEEIDKIITLIKSPEWKGSASINTYCLLPDRLPYDLKNEIYKLSENRPGNKGEFKQVQSPGATLIRNYFSCCVSLEFNEDSIRYPIDDNSIDGLVLNWEPIIKQISSPHYRQASFNCGPTFIYEYAAYLMTGLGERFPSIGIYGGLDCAGGFMDGCTYSMSLYQYEIFKFPLKDNIEKTIANLTDSKTIKIPFVKLNKYHYPEIENKTMNEITLINKTDDIETFALENDCRALYDIIEEIQKKNYRIDLKTYCKYVELLIEHHYPAGYLIYDCGCYILLPDNNDITEPELLNILKKSLQGFPDEGKNDIWPYVGFITILCDKDEFALEIRVDYRMAEYFKKFLEKLQ